MTLGIIGSGNIGKAIGSWAATLGYEVIFSARDEAHAKAAAQAAGQGAKAASVRGAVEGSDLVLLAVPYGAVKEILSEIRPLLRGKTVIDATNPLSSDFTSLTLGFTTSAAEKIAKLVPEAHVVKAFNTVFAQIYGSRNPKIQSKAISVFVAGDNKEAIEKVSTLIAKMGFDAVNSGPLTSARNIEPLAMLNIALGYGQGLGTGIGFTLAR
jgi:8-hydroxy-5-deazaflavin:NADPH oxidoreductase